MSTGGGAGLGTMQKLASVALVAPAASVDLQAIAATFAHLRIVADLRSDVAAVVDNALISFNNDAVAANYDGEFLQAAGLAAVASQALALATARIVGGVPGATSPAGHFGVIDLLVPNYASAKRKLAQFQSAGEQDRGAGNGPLVRNGMVVWDAVAAINRVTFTPQNGINFIAGSTVDLYGIP